MDGILTLIAAVVVITVALAGYAVGKATAAEECNSFGAFSNGSTVYKCEERKK